MTASRSSEYSAIIAEQAALISQLTAERDAAVKSADKAWDKCEDRRIEAHENWLRAEVAEAARDFNADRVHDSEARLEASEKRAKELEAERDALRDRLGYCYRRYSWAEN